MAAMLAAIAVSATLQAQIPERLDAQLKAIFEQDAYKTESFGPTAWLDGGTRYTSIARGEQRDLVAYDTATGKSEVLVAQRALLPPGERTPLTISRYPWSPDKTKLLIFTNTKKVWRQNTRGDYWVLDRAAGALKKLGGDGPEASLMFAKFSPDGAPRRLRAGAEPLRRGPRHGQDVTR